MAVSGTARISTTLVHTASDLGAAESITENINAPFSWTVADGTAANQADQVWQDERTLGAGASEDLDLAGGITNSFGSTLTMARVKGLVIVADSSNGSTITIGNATNAFEGWISAGGTIVLRAGASIGLFAPDATAYVVTAGTGDDLKILNDDGAAGATYKIVVIGASA